MGRTSRHEDEAAGAELKFAVAELKRRLSIGDVKTSSVFGWRSRGRAVPGGTPRNGGGS
jgi:hypothetical protein